jgi:predicted HicB family RNase H-like nuclease
LLPPWPRLGPGKSINSYERTQFAFVALSIRIEPELKAALERFASADKRSLASYVEIALQKHVDAEKGRKR